MIVRSDRRAQLTRHLLQALGFGAIAGIALNGACGGNVVVDNTTGTGTAGGQGGSSTTYSTSTVYDGTGAVYSGSGTVYSGTYTSTTFEAVGVGSGGGFGSSAVGVSVGVGAGQPSCFPTGAARSVRHGGVRPQPGLRAGLLDAAPVGPGAGARRLRPGRGIVLQPARRRQRRLRARVHGQHVLLRDHRRHEPGLPLSTGERRSETDRS